MAKIMISLPDKIAKQVRAEVEDLYHGRVGGLSIWFETLIRDHFDEKKPVSLGVNVKRNRNSPLRPRTDLSPLQG